jgi:hypothetical protein
MMMEMIAKNKVIKTRKGKMYVAQVSSVLTGGYLGNAGDIIIVNAQDDFKVTV